jgi:uncharacterized phage-like protein YoqJ
MEYTDFGYNIDANSWEDLRKYTCCFTGHRPHHIGLPKESINNVKRALKSEIDKAVDEGYRIFISGGALGVDMWAAEAVLEEKHKYPFIFLEMALPCINQSDQWKRNEKLAYDDLLNRADTVIYTSHRPYFEGCMKLRNEFIVRRSNKLIAVFNGKRFGGTSQTIAMAKDEGLDTVIINI